MKITVHMTNGSLEFIDMLEREAYQFIQWFQGNNFGETWKIKHKQKQYHFSRKHVMLITEE